MPHLTSVQSNALARVLGGCGRPPQQQQQAAITPIIVNCPSCPARQQIAAAPVPQPRGETIDQSISVAT